MILGSQLQGMWHTLQEPLQTGALSLIWACAPDPRPGLRRTLWLESVTWEMFRLREPHALCHKAAGVARKQSSLAYGFSMDAAIHVREIVSYCLQGFKGV